MTRANGAVAYKKLGFAFAQLESEQDAEKAVELLADKILDERPLVVKLATGTVKKPRKKASAKSATNTSESAESSKNEVERGSEEVTDSVEPKETKKKTKAKKTRKNKKVQQGEEDKKDEPLDNEASSTSKQNSSAPVKNTKKATKPRKTGPISTDTVLIRGLSADVTEEELKELLAEFEPEEIRIIRKKARTHKKGDKEFVRRPAVAFAFAKFSSEKVQQKVLEEVSEKTFQGKKLKTSPAVELIKDEEEAGKDEPVNAGSGSGEDAAEEKPVEEESPAAEEKPVKEESLAAESGK